MIVEFKHVETRFFRHLECDSYRDSQLFAELDFLKKSSKNRKETRKNPNTWQSTVFADFSKLVVKPSRECLISQIQEQLNKIQPSIKTFFNKPNVIPESPRPDASILNTTQTLQLPQPSPSFNPELNSTSVTEIQSHHLAAIPETRQKLYAEVTSAKTKLSTNLQRV